MSGLGAEAFGRFCPGFARISLGRPLTMNINPTGRMARWLLGALHAATFTGDVAAVPGMGLRVVPGLAMAPQLSIEKWRYGDGFWSRFLMGVSFGAAGAAGLLWISEALVH